jgi:catechol 2,3-dioxygenase-like lactoylglutathione lyase family enzyme
METLKITGSNVTIMVKNMDHAITFYKSIGLNLIQRWDDHYAMVGTEGITLGIHPAKEEKNSSGTVSIGFFVKDIADAVALLDQNNIPFGRHEDESGIYVNFTDSDGTQLYFTQPNWQ